MPEIFRTVNYVGKKFQWIPTNDKYIVIDTVTGKPERLGSSTVVDFDTAKTFVSNSPGLESRLIIVQLNCIAAFNI